MLHSPLHGIWWWEMDDWGGYRGLKPPSLPPSPGSKPLSALMWKNSRKTPSAWISSLGPQTPLTLLRLCGRRCSFAASVIMTCLHLYDGRVCVHVFVCVCQCISRLVLHTACWSYVNRAVSHLLWPGWESSGGPGSLWVPDLHVIHSWGGVCVGGGNGWGWGSTSLPKSKHWKERRGKAGRKEERVDEARARVG